VVKLDTSAESKLILFWGDIHVLQRIF